MPLPSEDLSVLESMNWLKVIHRFAKRSGRSGACCHYPCSDHYLNICPCLPWHIHLHLCVSFLCLARSVCFSNTKHSWAQAGLKTRLQNPVGMSHWMLEALPAAYQGRHQEEAGIGIVGVKTGNLPSNSIFYILCLYALMTYTKKSTLCSTQFSSMALSACRIHRPWRTAGGILHLHQVA